MVRVADHCHYIFWFNYFITRCSKFKNMWTTIPPEELACKRKLGKHYHECIMRMVKKGKAVEQVQQLFSKIWTFILLPAGFMKARVDGKREQKRIGDGSLFQGSNQQGIKKYVFNGTVNASNAGKSHVTVSLKKVLEVQFLSCPIKNKDIVKLFGIHIYNNLNFD